MLDLEMLAEKRARVLNQPPDGWLKVIWGAEFQLLSQSMSDGEVEALVENCVAGVQLEAAVKFLLEHARSGHESPFAYLLHECEKAGLPPADWIKAKFSPGSVK